MIEASKARLESVAALSDLLRASETADERQMGAAGRLLCRLLSRPEEPPRMSDVGPAQFDEIISCLAQLAARLK